MTFQNARKAIASILGALALLALTYDVASAFSILGTDPFLDITGNLAPNDMFRWNNLPIDPDTGIRTIYYRLDPAFTLGQQAAIMASFNTWNNRIVAQPNIFAAAAPWDLESIAAHEIGHTLGLAHPGIREEGPNNNYDTDNNPFNVMIGPDAASLALSPNRPILENYGGPGQSSASIMTYDADLAVEMQRSLEFDDLGGLNFAETGQDNLFNTQDDFIYQFLLDPLNPHGVVRDLPGPDGEATTQDDWDVSWAGGNGLAQMAGGLIDIFKLTELDPYLPWDPTLLGLADVVFDRNNLAGAGGFTILGADIYLVPPPGTLVLLLIGGASFLSQGRKTGNTRRQSRIAVK